MPIQLERVKILDHGFVQLIDLMGEDATPAMDARTSRGHQGERRPWGNTATRNSDANLTAYMVNNLHTTPFEMVETKWLCKMPIFVARQWVRHRTASITEFSMRYADPSQLSEDGKVEFYIPEEWRAQDPNNKQGSIFAERNHDYTTQEYRDACEAAIALYHVMQGRGVANEMARMVLPVSVYTEWVWKIDLHNLLHFLKLRTDSHASWEIQQYANAMLAQMRIALPQLMEIVWPAS